MSRTGIVVVVVTVLLFCGAAWGQCTASNGVTQICPPQVGEPVLRSIQRSSFDNVNLGNLNTHFEIPIVSRARRGIDFRYALTYDSWIWYPGWNSNTQLGYWQPVANWGWSAKTQTTGYYT